VLASVGEGGAQMEAAGVFTVSDVGSLKPCCGPAHTHGGRAVWRTEPAAGRCRRNAKSGPATALGLLSRFHRLNLGQDQHATPSPGAACACRGPVASEQLL
jgi:hypothetical protein